MAANAPVVLVTGCSDGGIGSALCVAFQKRGCRVFASARSLAAMQALADLNMDLIQMDVTDHASVATTVQHVIAKAGRIDVVVNNAGYGLYGPLVEADMTTVRKQYETNVFGALAVCQAVAPDMMRRRSGKIVNVGSISGIAATPFAGVYASTKAALHALSDTMRMELKPFNVSVIVVAPGAIKSEFSNKSQRSIDDDKLKNDSFYSPIQDAIAARQGSSQVGATPTAEFARATVSAILSTRPPTYFYYGRHSTLMPFLKRILPDFVAVRPCLGAGVGGALADTRGLERTTQDWIFMRLYGLLELAARVQSGAHAKLKAA